MLSASVMFGMFLAFTASSMNATGLNLQRLGQKLEKEAEDVRGKIRARNLNRLGIFLSTACGLVDLLSFGYAPQTVLAPFGAVTLVINLLLAPLIQGEELLLLDIASTALVVLGVGVCLAYGPSEAQKFSSVEELMGLITRPVSLLFVAALVMFICALGLHAFIEQRKAPGKFKLSVAATYPVIAGTAGSLTALLAKVFTFMIELRAGMQAIGLSLLTLVSCAVCAPVVMNLGLGKFSPLLLVPIFSATFVVMGMLGGGIVFNEFSRFSLQQWGAYSIGLVSIVSGVLMLTSKANETKPSASPAKKRAVPKKRSQEKVT